MIKNRIKRINNNNLHTYCHKMNDELGGECSTYKRDDVKVKFALYVRWRYIKGAEI